MKRFWLIVVALLLSVPATSQIGGGGVSYIPLANVYANASILRARDYNILPSNTATQNDAGFTTLKTAMQASATTVWRVVFEPGIYLYTNNRWLFNVQNFICECYGTTFQNTSSSAAYIDGIPIYTRDMFDDAGDVAGLGSSYVNGDLINTAAAGATSVTTTTASNAGHFSIGNRVIIMGYDQQQAGYPPNLRYFEQKTVSNVNAGTGVVTFTSQLQNSYDSRWWDTTYPDGDQLAHGAPRILSIDRTNYKRAKLLWFRGATLAANTNTPSSYAIQVTADLGILEDVRGVGLNAYASGTLICSRCTLIGDQTGIDKMVDRVVIEDSLIDPNPGFASALTDCVGINDLTINRSRFLGAINQCAPRSLVVQDTDIIPAASAGQGIGTAATLPIRSVVIGGTRVFNTGSLSNGFTNKATPGNSFTVGSVSGTTLQMTWNAAAKTVADNIDYGMSLTDTTQSCTALVTGIFLTGGNTLNITQTGCAAPVGGDSISYYDVMQASDAGGNAIVGTQVPFWRGPPGPTITSGPTISGSPTITDNLFFKAVNQTTANQIVFQNQSYGLQIASNGGGANIGYLSGSSFNMSNGSTLSADTLNANSAGLAVSQGTKTVNIGTGTTTGLATIGGGSNGVVINSNQAGSIKNTALISSGTKFTTSGCSISATTGGAAAGTFTLGANTCTAVVTINGATGLTSNTGWSCQAHDRTAPTVLIGGEASSTATTASFTIPAGAGATDVIAFSCTGY